MSSLALQLSEISVANQTVALDRKKRSKLHSVSLIYDPKFAATQDYGSIFANALEALEELENIDRRFSRFRNTVFSETSVDVDRLVQSKEQNENLDAQVNAFLNLLAPYWDLSIALRLAEWPLRRFQINVYNLEELILSALPYYNHAVFNKILYIIPQNRFPNIFQWLFNFKKIGKNPSQNVIVKAFTDLDFNKFYSKHLIQQLTHKNQNTKQLVFYLGSSIACIVALQANDLEKLSELTPIVLEISGELLKSSSQDSKLTAYSVLAVLASCISLSGDVIFAIIESILSSKLTRQSFGAILKIYQTLQSFEVLPLKILNKLKTLETDSDLQDILFKDSRNSKFTTSYIRACIINEDLSDDLYDNVISKAKITSSSSFKLLLENLLAHHSSEDQSYKLFKWLINENKDLFLSVINDNNSTLADLEMSLQKTLVDEEVALDSNDIDELTNSADDLELEDLKMEVPELTATDVASFLVSNSATAKVFNGLIPQFISSIEQEWFQKFTKSVFPTPESSISFLLRIALTYSVPSRARLHAISILRKRFKEILKRKTSLFLTLPFIIVLLSDRKQSIRTAAVELIRILESNEKEDFEDFFLSQVIYGPNSANLASLSNKEIKLLYLELSSHAELYKLDPTLVYSTLNHVLEHDKKNNKVLYAVFVSHALVNNIPAVKLSLFNIVTQGRNVVKGVSLPSQLFEDFLKNYFDDRATWKFNCEEAHVNFLTFEETVVDLVSLKEKNHNGVEFLISLITSGSDELSQIAIKKLVSVYSNLKLEFQIEVLTKIIDLSVSNVDPIEILESLHLSNEVFVLLLKRSTLTQNTEVTGAAKRRRRSSQTTRLALKDSSLSKMASDHLNRITLLLEVLLATDLKSVSFELLQRLFNALSDLETLDNDGNLPVTYTQETLASCMLKVVNILKQDPNSKKLVDQSTIRADSIIATIRTSSSPQVQNKLLLVVAALASLTPQTVLHSVMPIFTFMGAHTIRQDDEFSNQVVEQTILCVVPALTSAAENGQIEEIEFLTASFVSAFQHIPRHRRVKLFTTLAKTLGAEHSISLILFLCGQQYSALYNKHKMADCRTLLEFISSFLKNFESDEQLEALLKYLQLWNLLPVQQLDHDSEMYKKLISRSVFGVNILSLSDIELRTLRNNMIRFLDLAIIGNADLSSLPHLRLKISSALLDSDESKIDRINSCFAELVQYILHQLDLSSDEISTSLYKLLGDVLELLPIEQFVDSVLKVIGPDSELTDLKMKRHLTVLTGTKFDLESSSDPSAQEAAQKLIPLLVDNVVSKVDPEVSQSSLDALSAIFKKFSNSLDPSLLISTLTVVVGDAGLLYKDSPEVLISSIHCITNIVSIIGVKMIGFFPKIVPRVFEIYKESEELRDKELLQVSILILFSCMIKKLPVFMLSNLKDIFKLVLTANEIPESTRLSVLDVIVQHLNLKEVLNSLTSIWKNVAQYDLVAIGMYLHTIELTIEKIDKKTASGEAVVFIRFLLHALEYRSQSKFDNNTIHRIELSLFQCGINFVMKLNDKSFRPLFASMTRWAFDGEGVVTEISEVDRLLAFFRFFNKLQESLRSIVTSYYSYLLENVEKLFSRYLKGELTDINLRRIILISLTSSFKFDQDEFWATETRFEVVTRALTDQLVNIEDGIGKYLVKAIASVASSCASESHNKFLNDLMITHLNLNCASREKFWAARSMKMIYQKVGDQWLSLLPQLVPLIAELLEDDEEEVEHEVRAGLVKVIESVLGEPLDRYLD